MAPASPLDMPERQRLITCRMKSTFMLLALLALRWAFHFARSLCCQFAILGDDTTYMRALERAFLMGASTNARRTNVTGITNLSYTAAKMPKGVYHDEVEDDDFDRILHFFDALLPRREMIFPVAIRAISAIGFCRRRLPIELTLQQGRQRHFAPYSRDYMTMQSGH